jgi:hypothetical protein
LVLNSVPVSHINGTGLNLIPGPVLQQNKIPISVWVPVLKKSDLIPVQFLLIKIETSDYKL